MFKNSIFFLILLSFKVIVAQTIDSTNTEVNEPKGVTISLGDKKSIKINFLLQTWLRYTETNPGTTIYGDPKNRIADIGLRRSRITLSGSPTDKVFIYTQFGMNNFNSISEREAGFFFHDAITEYEVTNTKLFIGGGLTAWAGFSRFSTPGIGSILGLDAPLYAQATNGATDQFLRKLALYAKGDLGKLNYRVAVAKPMSIQQSSQNVEISANSSYSDKAPHNQYQGYFCYNFFDKEKLETPYFTGTYLGKKKVFNIGVGFLHQQSAMHRLNTQEDTIYSNLNIFSVDIYYDVPFKDGSAISTYIAYHNYNFGSGYLRNIGAMNPANGLIDSQGSINGTGNATPVIGTGNNYYFQIGHLIGSQAKIKFMPYASVLFANYDRLQDNMVMYDTGINMFFDGHKAKLTLGYQNRPIFMAQPYKKPVVTQRNSMLVLQYQIAI